MSGDVYGNPLVFIPTYNEAGNIRELTARLGTLAPQPDILFIDDASPDGTGRILDELAAANSAIRVIHRPCKKGVGSAHLEAIAFAYEKGYPLLVTMDADFTHPPEAVPKLVEKAKGADLVVGSRFVDGGMFAEWRLWRKALSLAGHWATTRLLGLPQDATGAFRAYRLDRIPRRLFAPVRSAGYAFFFESLFVLWQSRVVIHELPVMARRRRHGRSKMGLSDMGASIGVMLRLLVRLRLSGRR